MKTNKNIELNVTVKFSRQNRNSNSTLQTTATKMIITAPKKQLQPKNKSENNIKT